jgi:hypothetical protein
MNDNNSQNININIIENNNDNIINSNNDCDDDGENESENEALQLLLKEIENYQTQSYLSGFENNNFGSTIIAKSLDYEINYNIKQLIRICDYYGISKDIKINKLKKNEIINFLLMFEENIMNSEIVYKREQLWYFMSELKTDKFMKKFIIW